MRKNLYYLFISLYGSINFVIGTSLFFHYLISPEMFADAVGDVVIGVVMMLIGFACFAMLLTRGIQKPKRRSTHIISSLVLSLFLIPTLMVLVVADFFTSDSIKPAYCREVSSTIQGVQSTRYECDIRALNLDTLNNPDVPFLKDFTQGRSSKVFIASTLSFVTAAFIATMVTIKTVRLAKNEQT